MPMTPSREVGPESRVSRKAWNIATSRQTRSSRFSVSRVPMTLGVTAQADESCRALGHPQQQGDPEHDQGGDQEEQGKTRSSVEGLTESGEQRRQTRRGEAAAVEGSGVGPDPAGVHDGLVSSGGCWSAESSRGSRRMASTPMASAWRLGRHRASGRCAIGGPPAAWGRRVIDQPASDHPASGHVTGHVRAA